MSTRTKFLKYTLIYFLLIFGFIYLYAVDAEKIIYGVKDESVKSKVDFVYQQF